ncbi:MAG: long-chain acyl-CoA synthetase, partial [Gemmatimonadetes bacterium]|nr:long-chain acyl-CoA synthetase [Gemmatimonadota bacterium]
GHNVAPEPIEQALARRLPGASQIVLLGSGRPHLAAVITGNVTPEEAETALMELNEGLPHYQRIAGSVLREEPFSIESGLVTANGKLRRDAIARAVEAEMARVYDSVGAPA